MSSDNNNNNNNNHDDDDDDDDVDRQNNFFCAIAFLRRFCHIALQFEFFGFHSSNLF
jgi:hypothetical protein